MSKENVAWAKTQEWWNLVKPLMDGGMCVVLHVPPDAFTVLRGEIKIQNTTSGGLLVCQECHAPTWHIEVAFPSQLKAAYEDFRAREEQEMFSHAQRVMGEA